jgi:hypothetical protein
MSKNNQVLYKFLQVTSWILFIGLCIEAGAWLLNVYITLFKPEWVVHMYKSADFSALRAAQPKSFGILYVFIMAGAVLKAYLFYVIVQLLHKLDLNKPFQAVFGKYIHRISYGAFAIGLVGNTAIKYAKSLGEAWVSRVFIMEQWADNQAYLLMGAIIYIIGAIFKKGVDLQQENDLTV